MEALDLRVQRPRGPRVKLAGLVFTARVIDKLRGTLDGGNEGPYFPFVGLSALWSRYTKVDLKELRAIVAVAEADGEVESWITERIGHVDVGRFNSQWEGFTTAMLPEQWRAIFEERHPEDLRQRYLNSFDLLEADDERFYAHAAPS